MVERYRFSLYAFVISAIATLLAVVVVVVVVVVVGVVGDATPGSTVGVDVVDVLEGEVAVVGALIGPVYTGSTTNVRSTPPYGLDPVRVT